MNIILGLLIATVLIAGMILLRMLADHYVLRSRIRGRLADAECEQAGCFSGCDRDDGAARNKHGVAGHHRNTKRSAHHAH